MKNEIKKIKSENLEFKLKNILRNGMKIGCSGYIKNLENGKVVYVNTEKSCYEPLSKKNLYRIASSLNDTTGGRNQFATDNELAIKVVDLLEEV